MKRLLRWAFDFFALLSAALFVGVCVLWVRGHWRQDDLSADFAGRAYQLTSGGGRLLVARSRPGLPASPRPEGVRWSSMPTFRWDDSYGTPWLATRRPVGLATVRTPSAGGVLVPQWLACLAAAPLPAAWLAGRDARHPRPGHCPACGYDLRATPHRCPECGAIPTRA